jgi:hypothetical protein
MATPISLLVNRILTQPAPVLFLDTCALLDIIKVPFRKVSVNLIGATNDIFLKASTNHLWIVTLDLVEKEWQDNVGNVSIELDKHLQELHDNLVKFSDTLDKIETNAQFYQTDLRRFDIVQKLYSLSEKLLKSSVIMENDDNCKIKAMDRVSIDAAPAGSKHGKNEAKDCMIIEHYLCLCRKLRNNTFAEKCLFVSSNTQDFGHPQRLRSPLDVEFANLNLVFAKDIAMANSMIKGL